MSYRPTPEPPQASRSNAATDAPEPQPVSDLYRSHCLWFFRTCRSPGVRFSVEISNSSDRVVDAVKARAEPNKHVAPGHFCAGGEIVDADAEAGADNRDHLAVTRGRGVGQIGYVDGEEIHGRRSGHRTAVTADEDVKLVL